MKIREAIVADAKAIRAIYAPYVELTAVTFEYNVPSEEEFRKRIETVKQKYPWIVAEADGKIEHVHECAVVLRWRHLDLSHPQTIGAHHRLLRQLLCITIIGIPWGKMHFRLAKLALSPFGMEVV